MLPMTARCPLETSGSGLLSINSFTGYLKCLQTVPVQYDSSANQVWTAMPFIRIAHAARPDSTGIAERKELALEQELLFSFNGFPIDESANAAW